MQALQLLVLNTAAQNETIQLDSGLLQNYRNECLGLAKIP